MNKKLETTLAYIQELFPGPQTELHYSTPFQLLVAVMLSAQATDKQVNKVTTKLFTYIKTSKDIVSMGLPKFQKAISSVNYYRTKAKHIFETAKILVKRCETSGKIVKNGIPSSLEELMQLPGVGVKTAKLIAHVLYNKPFIAVDTHIHRVSNRIGLVHTKVPEQTSEALEKLIPDIYKDLAHHGLVLFGRYHCTARTPRCASCKLKNICEYYKVSKL